MKAEDGISGVLLAQKSSDSEGLSASSEDGIGFWEDLNEDEKVLAKQADSEGRTIITQHLVQVTFLVS